MAETSLIYRSATIYEALMRLLYGRHHRARLELVAERVPPGASVSELCCGPGTLYRQHLRGRVGRYVGLDLNARFVAGLRAAGAEAHVVDLTDPAVPLPAADVVLIQASLYHFLPDATGLIERMLAAARQRVIVAEPVRNLASSDNPLVARLGRGGTDPGTGGQAQRFTEAMLDVLMARFPVREALLIPGGREKIYVLGADGLADGGGSSSASSGSS